MSEIPWRTSPLQQRPVIVEIAVWYCGPIQIKESIWAINGKTAQGKALYAKAKAIYAAAWEV